MSSSATSNRVKVSLVASFGVVAVVGAIGLWLPSINRLRHKTAGELRAAAVGKGADEAVGDYYASTLLEPRNQAAILTLADMQLAVGEEAAAEGTLRRLPGQIMASRLAEIKLKQGDYAGSAIIARDGLSEYGANFDLYVILAKAEIEQGHVQQSLSDIRQALAIQPGSVSAQTLYGLAGLVRAGSFDSAQDLRQGSGNDDTTNPVTAPEAARRVGRAGQDNVALAQELYALGLLSASQRVLAKLRGGSIESLRLRSQITLNRVKASHDDLTKAAGDLTTALKLNPADPLLWQLLMTTWQRLGDTSAASDAQGRLKRLQAARP